MARPIVQIRPTGQPGVWPGSKQHVVWCSTDGCSYADAAETATEARELAGIHRADHRKEAKAAKDA